jgi:threonine synthase
MSWPGLLEAYKEYLPVNNETPNRTLNEGNTPLINKGTKIVAVLTGNGLKNSDTAIASSLVKPIQLPNDEKAVTNHIRGVVHS